jgi:hypothetical protein
MVDPKIVQMQQFLGFCLRETTKVKSAELTEEGAHIRRQLYQPYLVLLCFWLLCNPFPYVPFERLSIVVESGGAKVSPQTTSIDRFTKSVYSKSTNCLPG